MEAGLNLSQLAKYFSDEDAARALLEEMRWGTSGAVCPHRGGVDPYKLTPKATSKAPGRKGLYKCKACRKQFTVTVGTVFEDSRIPISKWLLAIHLIASSKKGMSAHQIHRNLGISYKAAWFMMHRLRYAMSVEPMASSKLRGVVEVDELAMGGKRKAGKGRVPSQTRKAISVVALVERGSGRVKAFTMPRVTADNLSEAIKANVHPNARVVTDEYPVYKTLGLSDHHTVNHKSGEYVRGEIYSNTAEGFFSLLKRGIVGTFHHIGTEHLQRYCDEFAFRYSARKVDDATRAEMIYRGSEGKRLTYKQPARASEGLA